MDGLINFSWENLRLFRRLVLFRQRQKTPETCERLLYLLRVRIAPFFSSLRMQESPCEQVVRRCLYSQA